eukprot:COSAG02_NODE_40433_length_405_cov_1.732026_1_plen_50_part_10
MHTSMSCFARLPRPPDAIEVWRRGRFDLTCSRNEATSCGQLAQSVAVDSQ